MPGLPTGTVTFLFTDIEGSTALLQRLGDRRYGEVLEEHRRLLRAAFAEGNGQEVDTQGDAFLVVFPRARDAVRAAVTAQRALKSHAWSGVASLQVRMGLHVGEPVSETGRYIGLDVHRAARISAAGHGGQILLSEGVAVLAAPDLPAGVSLRDLGPHRLKDLQGPEHLLQVVHPDLPTDFPPLKSLDAHPNNLPRQLTSFIGRQHEMEKIEDLLATTSLLTLTGAGGSGKTRLALQVATGLLDRYPDGVWIAQLVSLSEPALVPKAVASAVGASEQLGRPLTETVVDHLRHRSLLLLLDNCEHVLAACGHLVEVLLQACPRLRLLVTSREALGIAGEVIYRVPSLSLPDLQPLPGVEGLTKYEAVRLFVERAAFSRPGFEVTSSNAGVVAQVVHRLDGIPLAIELAAARLKVLTVAQIASRLDDRFRLLTGGSRNTLPRQQTLRAVMDWSHALLSEKEQAMLRRLAVFAGGFTLDAAEAISIGDDVQAPDILDLLAQLVDKSLVEVETKAEEARYWLLETVRQYSLDRLVESGEAAAVRRWHRDWYLRLAERAEAELRGPAQQVWLERLEVEHDNLRSALVWSKTDEVGVEAWLRLVGTLFRFWHINGHWIEGRGWLEEALAKSGEAQSSTLVRIITGAAGLAYQQGDYERSRDLTAQALALSQKLGDQYGMIRAIAGLGNHAVESGDFERATALGEESVTLSRKLDDKWLIGWTLQQLADCVRAQGDYERAARLGMESVTLCKEVGDNWRTAVGLRAMGNVSLRQRDYSRAAAFYADSLKLCRGMRNRWVSFQCLEGLGCVASGQGQYERAAMLFGAAESLRESLRSRRDADYQAEVDHHLKSTRTSLGDTAFSAAWAKGRAMTLEQAIEYALAMETD